MPRSRPFDAGVIGAPSLSPRKDEDTQMTNDHDTAMSNYSAELFARATQPSEVAPPARISQPLQVKREGTLSNFDSKLDRAARLFAAELFGRDL